MKRKRTTPGQAQEVAPARPAKRASSRKNALAAAVPVVEARHDIMEELSAHVSPRSLIHPDPTQTPRLVKAKPKTPGPSSATPAATKTVATPQRSRMTADAAAVGKGSDPASRGKPTAGSAGSIADAQQPSVQAQNDNARGAESPAKASSACSDTSDQTGTGATVREGPLAATLPQPAAGSPSGTADRGGTQAASPQPGNFESGAMPDFQALAVNFGRLVENGGRAAAAYLQPREQAGPKPPSGEEFVQTMNSLGRVAESWLVNPTRMIEAQAALSTQLFALWSSSLARMGAQAEPEQPRVADKRFAAPEWRETPFFDFLHKAYLVTTDWAKAMVADAEGVDETTRDKAAFYLRQISSALSPSNFLATNPELLKETFSSKGENLVRGMEMLAEDIAAGNGELKIRQSDATKFKLGVDMASTPGKVVFRNDLMELIQYQPSTAKVLKRPLLIVPPWINKFYVLDLNREKSFIRWAVSEGLTVFVISWVNPDERHARKDWDAYMQEGIFAALDAVEAATGERQVSTVGYCVGGTLLAATLAYMGVKGDDRVTSSTFLTTQVDFKDAGDLKVFADEAQIRTIEAQMAESGYLAGSHMANAFNMLRPDDLIWSYTVNAYLKGQPPKPFDLLAWNADSTRMSAANHAFYLRNLYLENRLTRGEMVMGGETLNLKAVTIPVYDLAAKEDHIAPARSVYNGSKFFGGPVRYVMAGSGHIAGVVNPPAKSKYQYWAGGKTDGSFDDWVETATEAPGTWWLDWIGWLRQQAPETVAPRVPGDGKLAPLCDAPGEYVRVQS